MMRKLLFICLTILFVACSSDDNTSHSDSLIGKWKEVSFTVDGVVPDDLYIDECGTDSMEFIDDSVIIFTEWWDCEVSQYRVNYRLLSGGRIEVSLGRSEERRVGKEWGSQGWLVCNKMLNNDLSTDR